MRALWFWLAAALAGAAAAVLIRRHLGRSSYVAVVANGNALLARGDAAGAARDYEDAARLAPESADIRLNLAIAYLRAGKDKEAIDESNATLALDRNNPAAYYVMGCAHMHLFEWEAAIRAFQQSQAISPRVAAVSFQLGLAHEQLGQLDAAVHDFEATTLYDPSHAAGHFRLSRLYRKVGRLADAEVQMKLLQDLLAKPGAVQPTPTELEECLYTRPRAPFILEQPPVPGIPVHFVNATADAFGGEAARLRGPIAAIDYDSDGRNSLFARDAGGSFLLLDNRAGRFKPLGRQIPATPGASYSQVLVGDIDNDGTPDVVVLGEEGSRLYRFRSGGRAVDYTSSAGIDGLRASSGLLADLDFTGNLDIVAVRPAAAGLQVYRNLGEFAFADATDELGLPADLPGTLSIDEEDWGNDGLPTLLVARKAGHPDFYSEHRATGFTKGGASDRWPQGSVVAGGDLNNDLETDAVVAGASGIDVLLSGRRDPIGLATGGFRVAGLLLSDFDNDGWLDILAYGPDGIRLWRNEGHAGFRDVTQAAGLSSVGPVTGLVAADFSGKGAEDLMASTPGGLVFLRNEGAEADHLLRLRLKGTRSNASAIGARIELTAGSWRTSRTVHTVPIEFGTGVHAKLDSVTIHWTDATTANPGVVAAPGGVAIVEPKIPTGSCPYLYAWDGSGFRFVSDVLGAAPLGLPMSLTSLVPSNPREILALGDERQFPQRSGAYELRLTDELREILYLDEARLLVVDHPEGTIVCPTSKLLEGPPFPAPELWTLRPLRAPLRAFRSDGLDVTDVLARADGRMAGPVSTRRPQMRGYAQPYSVTMDFGELDTRRPLVLALTGWLQFGGGMANIAASFDPKVGPPFPRLEAQLPDGTWSAVRTDVGAPCGKTKTILVDLGGRLPEGARRLRITTSFEIYWDAALLCERVDGGESAVVRQVEPARADLRWRGFSRYEPEVAGLPLVPSYDRVSGTPRWDFTPTGWCTRYGDVRPLVNAEDDRLAVLNGGDEVALSFPGAGLPRPGPGRTRDFFLYLSGWDKDADFHVRRGGEVEPMPHHGMDDQRYGAEPAARPRDAAWMTEYDTRWVGPATLARQAAPSD
ncbi:MAG TPA: FG-GAP-like repeat-containing protein [Opitutaceae bacterium]|jgi:hypothetical protein